MNEQTYYIRKASFEKVSQASAIDFELVKIGRYFLKFLLCTRCFLVWTLIRYQNFFQILWGGWTGDHPQVDFSQNCLQVSEKSRF
jgi:hypothetical protein